MTRQQILGADILDGTVGAVDLTSPLVLPGNLSTPGWALSKPTTDVSLLTSLTDNGVLVGGYSNHLAANAYVGTDGNWNRTNTAQPATLLIVRNTGAYEMFYAPAGTNPITWTKSYLRLGNVSDTDTAWVVPSFQNSYSAYSGPYAPGYRKMPDGTVVIRGLMNAGTAASAAFQLPAGYRPQNTNYGQYLFTCQTSFGLIRMDVTSAGIVLPGGMAVGSTGAWTIGGWISMDGMRFLGEA